MWLIRLSLVLAVGAFLVAAQSSPDASSRKIDPNDSPLLIYAFEGDPKSSGPNESKNFRRSIPPLAMGGMGLPLTGLGYGGMGGMGLPMGGFGMAGLAGIGAMGGMGGMGYFGPYSSSMYNPAFRGYPGSYNSMANTAGMTFPYWNTQVGTGWSNPSSFNNFASTWNSLNSNPSMYNSGTWGLTNVVPSSSGFGSNDLYNSGAWNRVNFNSGDPYNQYSGQNGFVGGQNGFYNGQSYYNRYNGQSGFGSGQGFASGTSGSFGSDSNNYKRSPPGPQSPYYVRLFPDPLNQDTEETSSSSLSKSRVSGRRSAETEQHSPRSEPL